MQQPRRRLPPQVHQPFTPSPTCPHRASEWYGKTSIFALKLFSLSSVISKLLLLPDFRFWMKQITHNLFFSLQVRLIKSHVYWKIYANKNDLHQQKKSLATTIFRIAECWPSTPWQCICVQHQPFEASELLKPMVNTVPSRRTTVVICAEALLFECNWQRHYKSLVIPGQHCLGQFILVSPDVVFKLELPNQTWLSRLNKRTYSPLIMAKHTGFESLQIYSLILPAW